MRVALSRGKCRLSSGANCFTPWLASAYAASLFDCLRCAQAVAV